MKSDTRLNAEEKECVKAVTDVWDLVRFSHENDAQYVAEALVESDTSVFLLSIIKKYKGVPETERPEYFSMALNANIVMMGLASEKQDDLEKVMDAAEKDFLEAVGNPQSSFEKAVVKESKLREITGEYPAMTLARATKLAADGAICLFYKMYGTTLHSYGFTAEEVQDKVDKLSNEKPFGLNTLDEYFDEVAFYASRICDGNKEVIEEYLKQREEIRDAFQKDETVEAIMHEMEVYLDGKVDWQAFQAGLENAQRPPERRLSGLSKKWGIYGNSDGLGKGKNSASKN